MDILVSEGDILVSEGDILVSEGNVLVSEVYCLAEGQKVMVCHVGLGSFGLFTMTSVCVVSV